MHQTKDNNVVFPEPDGPIIKVSSPLLKVTVVGCNATTVVSPERYVLLAFLTSTIVLDIYSCYNSSDKIRKIALKL